MSGNSGTGGIEYQVWPPQCGGPIPCTYWPQDAVALTHLTRHAAVMGPTWGVLIPATILMARLRHKKGLWFKLHQALAVLSLTSVVVGAFLGRQLSYSHPPVTLSAKVHKVLGYTVTSFIVAQALSALLWRPLAGHSYRPVWNMVHKTWGTATLAVGTVAVFFGIHIAGIGWPYYPVHIMLMVVFLFAPSALISHPGNKLSGQKTNGQRTNEHVTTDDRTNGRTTNGHITSGQATSTITDQASGLLPWLFKQQKGIKQA